MHPRPDISFCAPMNKISFLCRNIRPKVKEMFDWHLPLDHNRPKSGDIHRSAAVAIDYKFRYLLDDWQKEVVEVLNDKFRELLRASDDVLMDFADKAESGQIQNHFFDAQREIWLKMEDMSLDFHDLLTKNLSQFPLYESSETPKLGSETLSLVNIDLYERNLALHTLAEKAEQNNQQELYLLAQRLSVINNGQPVTMEQIPASPHQLCEVFARCVNRLSIEKDALLVLYTLFDKYVLSALPELHEKLNQSLVKAGILPTLKYKVKGSPAPAPAAARKKEVEPERPQTPEELGEETMRRIHELLQLNRARRRKKDPLPPGVSPATPQEVIQAATSITLQQATAFPDEETLFQPVDHQTLHQVQEEMATQREIIKQKVGGNRLQDEQEDIIDLVGLLFEQMLDDESIPNAAKALLGHLHTPYIKIGLSDPDFFSNPEHPSRVFLDKAIAAAAVWVDEIDLKEGIYPFLKDTVYNIVRLRRQSREDFESYIEELEKEVSEREQKFQTLERHKVEAEMGKEHLLQAKEAANRATAEIFGGHTIPAYCKHFLDEVWVDYLTLLQLREDGEESQAWQEALSLGRQLLQLVLTPEQGLGRAAQVETLASQLRDQVGSMLPHQERKVEEFIEALYAPPREEEVVACPPPEEKTETAMANQTSVDEETLQLYNRLRQLPTDTLFEFNAGTDESYRAKLSWYNPMTDHFLFMTPRGRKSMLVDIAKLAKGIQTGSVVYFTDIKQSFWNRAMNKIRSLLEKEELPVTGSAKA